MCYSFSCADCGWWKEGKIALNSFFSLDTLAIKTLANYKPTLPALAATAAPNTPTTRHEHDRYQCLYAGNLRELMQTLGMAAPV